MVTRSTLEFLVLFDDDTKVWKDFLDPDFRINSVLMEYIEANPILLSLKYTLQEWKRQQKLINAQQIKPFRTEFIDLRMYNLGWRKKIQLPDLTESEDTEQKKYVFEVQWQGFQDKSKLSGLILFTHMDYSFTCSNSMQLNMISMIAR